MTDYKLRPAGTTDYVLKLRDHSLDPPGRSQRTTTERHDQLSGTPSSTTTGLEPGEIRFRGYWWGSDAETIANNLRDEILNTQSVNRVEVQAVDSAGNDISDPFNGTYRLTDDGTTRRTGESGNGYYYELRLIED